MCESTVFIEENENQIEFMNDVAKIEVTPEGITCYDIVGEKKTAVGVKFKIANLVEHKIIFGK
jgi:predicted RNA-binding protein